MIETMESKEHIILYKKRWIMLILYIFYAFSNCMQFSHYTIIADVVMDYYGVSYSVINWSILIKSVTFILLSFPGNYLIDKIGVRKTVLVGIVGTCAGTCIKFGSVHPDRFWVAILAQGVIATFHICVTPLLPKFIAVWFGAKETATAYSIGLVGVQLAMALSFLLPPLMVFKGEAADVESRLNLLNFIYSAFCILMAIILFFFFENAPPTPPSVAQKKSIEVKQSAKPLGFIQTWKTLFTNKSYVIYMLIFAINTRTLSPFQTMLNEIVLHYYPKATYDAGVIGLMLYFFGIIGVLTMGLLLDKFKNFKQMTFIIYAIYFSTVALFIGILDQGLPFVYITASLMGMADSALYVSAMELAIELTYPQPENISIGLVMIMCNVASIVLVLIYAFMFESVGIFWANIFIVVLILTTDLFFVFIKFDLKRQKSQNLTLKKSGLMPECLDVNCSSISRNKK